ncbi:hypothetical protein COB72_09260 [bacterium]|nr:MAG: hypothetical protein COB72_09260 [bacterium]
MANDMDSLLDLMSEDTQALLASETITIRRVRVQGIPDPVTFQRDETSQPNDTLKAVTGEEQRAHNGRVWVTRNVFTVRVADTTFKPGRENKLFDAAGHEWKITHCTRSLDGREYVINAQRVG